MANILIASVTDAYLSDEDVMTVSMKVFCQEGSSIANLNETSRSINLKTLGVYCTTAQLNNKILDKAAEYAAEQSHDETWTPRYVIGGFGSLA